MGERDADVTVWGEAVQRAFELGGEALARWTRLAYEGPDQLPVPPPALLVSNHGFGGIFDPNVLVLAALLGRLLPEPRPRLTVLTHELAWTVGFGPLLEPAGFRPASWEAAQAGFEAGGYVVVLPGGDLDAGKSFAHRNEVRFGGRTGFARLALDAGVPIVPIVIAGGASTAFVLSDGQRLARALRLDRTLRTKTLPVSLSLPWGLSIGVAGMLPFLPFPVKMRATVLDPIAPEGDVASLAGTVHERMQSAMDALTDRR